MKCPYCGEKGAKVLPNMVSPDRLIHSAMRCPNPECTAYDAITFGYHEKMGNQQKDDYRKILRALRGESDFDLIAIKRAKA